MSRELIGQDSVQTDDAYWRSLFQLEEAAAVQPPADAAPDELGPTLSRKAPVSDNGTPTTNDPWEDAQTLMAGDGTVGLVVVGYNKGGLIVYFRSIQGFVPASQLVDFPQFHLEREKMQALSEWRDRLLQLKVIEVDRDKSRLIFSERAALVEADERMSLLTTIKPGDKVQGTITNLTKFGAFADLGGVEGLIHISEISWSRVTHPGHVLKPGQELELLVLSVDIEQGRIGLSKKQLHPDPWLTAEEKYKPNQLVRGIVSNIPVYGAFVVVEEELEGLVHISEMAEGVFLHPRDVVQTGDEVVARVLHVNAEEKRLQLSLKGVDKPADTGS